MPAFSTRVDTLHPRTETYLFNPFDPAPQFHSRPTGTLLGPMQIGYSVSACPEEGACPPVRIHSGPFEVTPPLNGYATAPKP